MKYKKIIIDTLVILFGFVLFILWYDNLKRDAMLTNASLSHLYKIYLITVDKENQYWDNVNQGAAKMAGAIGVTYNWDAPKKKDVALQIEIINNAVNNGANAILIAADDPKKISNTVEDAKARGVKIIYVDSPANEEAITTLATDNYEAGKLAGEAMLQELEKSAVNSGKIGIIGVDTTKENTLLRENGFREIINADKRFTLLDTRYMNGDPILSKDAAADMINENNDLVGLFGTNEGSSIGVGSAIKEDNNRVVGIGFDKTDIMLELLKEGSFKAIMVQNPFTMGYLGVAEAMAALRGKETGPSYINTGISVLRNE